jgi:lipoprotein-anchoring transpeptidase ErfK/SrfK
VIGDVDEANSAIGVALLHVRDEAHRAMLGRIQNELFDLGADLATPGEDFTPGEMVLRVTTEQVARLEREIDGMNEELEPLRSFILPGGGALGAADDGAGEVEVAWGWRWPRSPPPGPHHRPPRRARRRRGFVAGGAQPPGAHLPEPSF